MYIKSTEKVSTSPNKNEEEEDDDDFDEEEEEGTSTPGHKVSHISKLICSMKDFVN